MNTSNSPASETSAHVAQLFDELKTSRSHTFGELLCVLFAALFLLGGAWLQGRDFFTVFLLGLMAVIVPLALLESRLQRQIDLLHDLVRELQKERKDIG